MNKQFLFIINPISGNNTDRKRDLSFIRQKLDNPYLRIFETTGSDDYSAIRELASVEKWDGALIGGGDGTINLVAKAIDPLPIPIGIIPQGSANGLAACLNISETQDTIEAILSGSIKPIDSININGNLCLHLADFGFNAGMIKKYDKGNLRGMVAYFKSTLQEYIDSRPYHFTIDIDKQQHQIEARMIVIANGPKYGTQAIINPGSEMDDGKLEIIALNPQGLDDVAALSVAMFRGTLKESPLVKTWSVSNAKVSNPDNAAFQIDGEVINDTYRVEISCEPGKFRFFVPA